MQNRITLQFLSTNDTDQQLASDYWRLVPDSDRLQWVFTVKQLAEQYGFPQSEILSTVKKIATAFDAATNCQQCHTPQALTSRSSLAKRPKSNYFCTVCHALQLEARHQALETKEQERRESQRAILREFLSDDIVFDYTSLDYMDTILVYALLQFSEGLSEHGDFAVGPYMRLCANQKLSNELLTKLYKKKILLVSPETPFNAVIFNEDGSSSLDMSMLLWRFARDEAGRSLAEVFHFIGLQLDSRKHRSEAITATCELWQRLALDDALTYLSHEVATYRISTYRAGSMTEAALLHALHRFPIPKVRRAIVNVVKDATSFSQKRDCKNTYHALNTIPGKLISYVDRALSDKWQVYPTPVLWSNEPVLLQLLFNRVLAVGLTGFQTLTGTDLESRRTEIQQTSL